MEVYIKHIRVTLDDLDQLNHVNNVRYVQWVQDIAEEHWLKKASKADLESVYWVLLKHEINYKFPAVLDDHLELKTYVSKSEGVTSVRHVEIINQKTGKLLVTSKTTWCLIDMKNHKPTRIPDHLKRLFD